MIVGLQGGLGSGKTIGMVRYLYKDNAVYGRPVYANFWLGFKYNKLNIKELLNNKIDLHNVSIGIDELTVFADCRSSISNRLISYFVLQTRKRNVCLYFTTQDFGMIDKRIMRHCHIRIMCTNPCEDDSYPYRIYEVVDTRRSLYDPPSIFQLDIRPYFNMYDTDEIISPLEEVDNET